MSTSRIKVCNKIYYVVFISYLSSTLIHTQFQAKKLQLGFLFPQLSSLLTLKFAVYHPYLRFLTKQLELCKL